MQTDWSVPQRQSRSGIVIIFYKALLTIVKAIWPFLLLFFLRQSESRSDWINLAVIGISVVILAGSLIEYFYFRFFIHDEELIIRKGFINKKTIHIPLNHVQAVNIEQPWLHQLLHVAKLKIDTAGSESTEAEIDAIDIKKAGMLREYLLENRDIAAPEEKRVVEEKLPLIRLSFGDVLRLGVTANHIQTFFLIAAFSLSLYSDLEDTFGNLISSWFDDVSMTEMAATGILFLGILILVISLLVSLVRIALMYFDFKLTDTDQGFRIRSGLTSIRENLIPFPRIQFVSWGANWLRRKMKIYTLEFHHANSDEMKNRQKITVPLMHQEHIEVLLRNYHPPLQQSSFTGIHPVYAFRDLLFLGLPVGIAMTAAGYFFFDMNGLFFLLYIPYRLIERIIYRKNFRIYTTADALQLRTGAWGRENKILQWNKIQKLTLSQSLFQKRKGLASLQIITAAGIISIPYVDYSLATDIQNYAIYKIESTQKHWM